MMNFHKKTLTLTAAVIVATSIANTTPPPAKKSFRVSGVFVEGCSCLPPCPCELSAVKDPCDGIGAMSITSGSFGGSDISGCKIAYATNPGKWVRLYIDGPSATKRAAAEAFGRAVYSAFGPIEAVKSSKISLSGAGGHYTLSVDGGNTMALKTEPILGGDGKSAMVIKNIHDPVHPDVSMGKTLTGSYNDGSHNFTLSDSNSYFVDKMRGEGKL